MQGMPMVSESCQGRVALQRQALAWSMRTTCPAMFSTAVNVNVNNLLAHIHIGR